MLGNLFPGACKEEANIRLHENDQNCHDPNFLLDLGRSQNHSHSFVHSFLPITQNKRSKTPQGVEPVLWEQTQLW